VAPPADEFKQGDSKISSLDSGARLRSDCILDFGLQRVKFVTLLTNHDIKAHDGMQRHNHVIFFLVLDYEDGKLHDLAVLIPVLTVADSRSWQRQWLSKPDGVDRNQLTSQRCEYSALTQLWVTVKG